jgi:hypothetical protein
MDGFSVAVTKEDVRGTALIVVAVILILIFSSINHGLDGSISLERCVPGPRIAPCARRERHSGRFADRAAGDASLDP